MAKKKTDSEKLLDKLLVDMKGKNIHKEWAQNKDELKAKYKVPGPFLHQNMMIAAAMLKHKAPASVEEEVQETPTDIRVEEPKAEAPKAKKRGRPKKKK